MTVTSKIRGTREVGGAYQILMLVLCIYSVLAMALATMSNLPLETRRLLALTDAGVCLVFLADFVFCLIRSKSKWEYFRTWGWIDLLSSIPMVDWLRIGRIFRVLRILRVLRGLRATRSFVTMLFRDRVQSAAVGTVTVALSMVLFASIAILHFETHPDSNIRTADDAIWWAVSTVTTVGYGDRYPVSLEGRAIAMLLMTTGIGLFGALSGLIGAWLAIPEVREDSAEIRELKDTIDELKAMLMERRRHDV